MICGCTPSSKSCELIPDWANADLSKLKEILANIDWDTELEGLDTDSMWVKFKEILNKAQDDCVPRKARRSSNKPVWITRYALRTIRKKKRAWKLYKATACYQDYLKYKDLERFRKEACIKCKERPESVLLISEIQDC